MQQTLHYNMANAATCWLNIPCIGPVSYRNIIIIANNIWEWSYILNQRYPVVYELKVLPFCMWRWDTLMIQGLTTLATQRGWMFSSISEEFIIIRMGYITLVLTLRGLVTPYGDIELGQHCSGAVMACCLTTPSHYLNQSWLLITKVLWYSPESNFTVSTLSYYSV